MPLAQLLNKGGYSQCADWCLHACLVLHWHGTFPPPSGTDPTNTGPPGPQVIIYASGDGSTAESAGLSYGNFDMISI